MQPRSTALQCHAHAVFSSSVDTSALPPAHHAVFQHYRKQVDEGKITYDSVQVRAVRHFDLLYDQLAHYGGPPAKAPAASSSSWWQRLTGADMDAADEPLSATPKGLYIHGGVGCGKVRLYAKSERDCNHVDD